MPPWAKHACFSQEEGGVSAPLWNPNFSAHEAFLGASADQIRLSVIKATYVLDDDSTIIEIEMDGEVYCAMLEENAGTLAGEICIINLANNNITPLHQPGVNYYLQTCLTSGTADQQFVRQLKKPSLNLEHGSNSNSSNLAYTGPIEGVLIGIAVGLMSFLFAIPFLFFCFFMFSSMHYESIFKGFSFAWEYTYSWSVYLSIAAGVGSCLTAAIPCTKLNSWWRN